MGPKARGNFQVNWCKYASCAFHGSKYCNDCLKYSKLRVEKCLHCRSFYLEVVEGDEPYTVAHLQCPDCDSTFVLKEKDERND